MMRSDLPIAEAVHIAKSLILRVNVYLKIDPQNGNLRLAKLKEFK